MTEVMRKGPTLKGLRSHLKTRGIDPESCLMGGLMEDEEHGEYGLVVTVDCQLVWYERSTLSNELRKWEAHTDPAGLTEMFREAEVAYAMMKEGAGAVGKTRATEPERASSKKAVSKKAVSKKGIGR
jgi:hypothetical protein